MISSRNEPVSIPQFQTKVHGAVSVRVTHHIVRTVQARVASLELYGIAIVYSSPWLPEGMRHLLLAKPLAVLVYTQNIFPLLVCNHELPVCGLRLRRKVSCRDRQSRPSRKRAYPASGRRIILKNLLTYFIYVPILLPVPNKHFRVVLSSASKLLRSENLARHRNFFPSALRPVTCLLEEVKHNPCYIVVKNILATTEDGIPSVLQSCHDISMVLISFSDVSCATTSF